VGADEPLPAELPPAEEAAALRAAEATGMAIYRHDRAAAVATDAALRVRAFKKDKRVRGWITEERDGAILVTFLDASPAAIYRATVAGNGKVAGDVAVLESPAPLSVFEAGAATARTAALGSVFQPCTDSYNAVVLPGASENRWVVYLLPGTTRHDVVPVGGTYRIEIEAGAVAAQRGFTRSCIALPDDPRAVGLMMTHLLDATPTEAHVYWSLWAGKPMYLATPPNGTVWSIEQGRIERVERGE
jgi:hypothetical protein